MLRRSRALFGLAFATACVLAVSVHAPVMAGTKVIGSFRKPGGPTENWFTVMGHVARPQTYKLPTSNPSLVDFIRFAGDLQSSASGQIRVIRNGRVAIRIRYSPTTTEKLIPGDVVIVDSKSSQGHLFGNGSSGPAEGPQIGLIGVRPWPIIMQTAPDRATIRWITHLLGQAEGAADHVKAILPRNFAERGIDTRLPAGTALLFDPAWIDASRLPSDLPQPKDATQPPEPQTRPESARPPAPLPLPIGPSLAHRGDEPSSASVPGHSAVPTPAPITIETERQHSRDDEEFTRDILTHPGSRLLESNAGPDPADPGRTRVTDAPGSRPAPSPPVDARIAPERTAVESDEAPVENIDVTPAETPFTSQIERPAQIVRSQPVPEIDDAAADQNDSSEPGLVPEPDSLTELDPNHEDAAPAVITPAPSLALQAAGSAARPEPDPTPNREAATEPSIAIGNGPLEPVLPTAETPAKATSESSGGLFNLNRDNWPAVAITAIGCTGLAAALFMVLSILMQRPEPQQQYSQPQPVAHSDRYWLDRIINDEMPIEHEPIQIAADERLFGQPTRLLRVDEPHASIPKPHFLKRGGQSGGIPITPGAPDEPQPEQSDDDRRDKRDKRPTTYAPDRRDRTTTRRPVIPAAPAATAEEPGIVEQITATETAATPKFRIDTAHPATHEPVAAPPKKRVPGTRPGRKLTATAKTEESTREESPLDRILFQVDQGDRS